MLSNFSTNAGTRKQQHRPPMRAVLLCAREELNLDVRLRRPAFYPLNYGRPYRGPNLPVSFGPRCSAAWRHRLARLGGLIPKQFGIRSSSTPRAHSLRRGRLLAPRVGSGGALLPIRSSLAALYNTIFTSGAAQATRASYTIADEKPSHASADGEPPHRRNLF